MITLNAYLKDLHDRYVDLGKNADAINVLAKDHRLSPMKMASLVRMGESLKGSVSHVNEKVVD